MLGSGPKVKSQATVLWRQTRGLRQSSEEGGKKKEKCFMYNIKSFMFNFKKSHIGKILKFTGSLITLVITTFFVGSCTL